MNALATTLAAILVACLVLTAVITSKKKPVPDRTVDELLDVCEYYVRDNLKKDQEITEYRAHLSKIASMYKYIDGEKAIQYARDVLGMDAPAMHDR